MAGFVPTKPVVPGTATRIMTGAPLPRGADAVVMVEQTEDRRRKRRDPEAAALRRARTSCAAGPPWLAATNLLEAGSVLRPIEIGLLAEVGKADAWSSVPRPTRGDVLPTGNEIGCSATACRGRPDSQQQWAHAGGAGSQAGGSSDVPLWDRSR